MGCNANKAAPIPAGVNYTFQVIVDKATADKAGLKAVASKDGKCLVVEQVTDNAIVQGPTKADSSARPDSVKADDLIVCVNGIHGDANKMLGEITKAAKNKKLSLAILAAVDPPSAASAEPQKSTEPTVNAESGAAAAPAEAAPVAQDVPLKEDGTPRFDGVWNPKALINGKKLVWLVDNSETELTFVGENKCSVTFEGKVYTGTMIDDNKLEWDDGDVWERDATGQSGSAGGKRVSEQKEAMCAGLC